MIDDDHAEVANRSGRSRHQDLRKRVAQLESDLQACRTQAAQTERLRQLGTWSVDLAAGAVTWSEGTFRIFGLSPDEGITMAVALSFYPEDVQAVLAEQIEAAQTAKVALDLTMPFTGRSDRRGWVRVLGQIAVRRGVRHLVGVIEDITMEKLARDRLHELAYSDPLTGLRNRRALQNCLSELTDVEGGARAALVLVDVDRFKFINDAVGHAAGDRLLTDVAASLTACAGAGDLIARIGGDEFAMVLVDVDGKDALAARAERLVEAVRRLPPPTGCLATPSVSIGAALLTSEVGTPDELLRRADLALYRAKALGRDRAELYTSRLRTHMREQSRVLADVREAIKDQRLSAVYQPIVDLKTGVVRGVEALARVEHPTEGTLLPSAFLAALADPVLSMRIDDHMLGLALAQMRKWLDDAVPIAAVNVNLSEGQLRRPDLVEHVVELLAANRLLPEHLKFEVLETALLGRDTEQVARTVERLSELGVVSALDDFGTGYASLAHLREFRVQRFKIDRSFVAGICTDPFDRALTRSLIDLGHNLGIRVTAEGVETAEQLALLNAWGCDCAQGYFIGRPTSAEDLPALVARWYARHAAAMRAQERIVA